MAVLYLIVLLVVVFVAAHLALRPGRAAKPFIISHRGAKGLAPENTLMAVQEAVRRNVAWTEIDIRRAADGVLVVMHDASLRRTTGRDAAVEALTSAEIARLVVRTGPGVTPPAEDTVPLFDSILDCISTSPVTNLVVEVKDPERYPGIAAQIVEALRRAGVEDRVVVGSFDHAWLPEFHAAAPHIPAVPIADWWTRVPSEPPCTMVDYDWLRVIFEPGFVRRRHARGKQVLVWTVDHAWQMRLMLFLGVDGLTTNRPDVGQEVLGR